jgi:hypothetical protein
MNVEYLLKDNKILNGSSIETKLRPQFNNAADSSKFERKMISFKVTDIVYEPN